MHGSMNIIFYSILEQNVNNHAEMNCVGSLTEQHSHFILFTHYYVDSHYLLLP